MHSSLKNLLRTGTGETKYKCPGLFRRDKKKLQTSNDSVCLDGNIEEELKFKILIIRSSQMTVPFL